MVVEAKQDIPIIVVMDEESRQQHKPARLLEEGADDFFDLNDADHLAAVVRGNCAICRTASASNPSKLASRKVAKTAARLLLENIQEAIAYIHEGIHAYANRPHLRLFGYPSKEDRRPRSN